MRRLLPACLLLAPVLANPGKSGEGDVTWSEHIAPLVFQHCASCHRDGEAAPFPLKTYDEVRKRAGMLEQVIRRRYMPPWHPEPGWGEFLDERRLSDAEIELFTRWTRTGRKRGDRAREPAPPTFPSGWRLGEPDLVVRMAEPYDVPTDGLEIYRSFSVPLHHDRDLWVTAIDMRPSTPSLVHHCLFYLDDTGLGRRLEAASEEVGFAVMPTHRGDLGSAAIGTSPRHFPDGMAIPLPKGTDLVLNLHLNPTGKPEREQTTVGIYLAKERPRRIPRRVRIPPDYGGRHGLEIPAGAKRYRLRDRYRLPVDVDTIQVAGHAHYRGREIKAWARLPDGRVIRLFWIRDWDFNWQDRYQYREPVRLPAGTIVVGEVIFDNSSDNPRNPFDPPRPARWGPRSSDEMGTALFHFVAVRPEDDRALKGSVGYHRDMPRVLRARLRERLLGPDGAEDGAVRRADVSALLRLPFDRIDRDRDGTVTVAEFDAYEFELE